LDAIFSYRRTGAIAGFKQKLEKNDPRLLVGARHRSTNADRNALAAMQP
jgi:hypothetical protein